MRTIEDNILENQIYRDASKIAESFDKYFGKDVREISVEFSKIFTLLSADQENLPNNLVKNAAHILIQNTMNTIASSLVLLRHGYRLQPGILIRNIVESLGLVAAFIHDKNNYQLYLQGKLNSTQSVSIGKKVMPLLGIIYGLFSDEFAHIGNPHTVLIPISEFKEKDDVALMNLCAIRHAVHLTYLVTELLCFNRVQGHRYWKRTEKGFAYNPSESEIEWLKVFLGKMPGEV